MTAKSNVDKECDALIESIEGPPAQQPAQHTTQLLFLPTSMTAAAGGKAAGGKDRPAGTRFNYPTAEDLERYNNTSGERDEFIANDPVVRGSATRDPLLFLNTLKQEVAREAASMAYQRQLNEKMGRDISQVSKARIDALKKIADIEMEMRKIGFDQIDVYGEKFQKIFKLWITTIRDVASVTLTAEQLDLFFNRLTTEMDGWEDKAAELVR